MSLFVVICVAAKFPKDIVPIVPVSLIKSISLITSTQHYIILAYNRFPEHKCKEMTEWKKRVLKLCRFDVKNNVDDSSKFHRRIDVIISTWIRISKLMISRKTFYAECRHWIDGESTKMCLLDYCWLLSSNYNGR